MRPGGAPPPPPARINTDRLPGSLPGAPRLPTPLGLSPPPSPSTPPPRNPPQPPRTDMDLEPPTIRRTDHVPRDSRESTTSRATPVRVSDSPREESYESMFPPPRPKSIGAGWLVGLVLIGGLALLAFTVGKPYLAKLTGGSGSATTAPASNDKLALELAAGDRARTDGDWAGARDAFLRASVIDEKSIAAWDGLCTAESELAMSHWIAALAGNSTLEREQAAAIGKSAGTSCGRWSEIARSTPDGMKKVSSDLRPVRAIASQNDGPGVRVYLPSHPGNPVVEALAYLADAPKGDATTNKNAQSALARAEIEKLAAPADLALVAFGAGTSGNTARLQAALAELAKKSPRHMLLETLRGLALSAPVADAGAVDAGKTPPDVGVHDPKAAATVAAAGSSGGGGSETPAGDYRSLNEKGHKALASGEVAKAEAYFRAALSQHPGDVDALYGLGQIARSRGDHPTAISYFKQVLDTSAGFAPARLALADEQWATGDKAGAAKNYELYLERVSEGSGADRARQRLGKDTPKPEPKPEDEKP
jgi:tetratricopeptide (TPR) repeat protein